MNAIVFRENGGDGTVEIAQNGEGFYIETEQPWQGSSEAGFGVTCGVTITVEQARELSVFLLNALRD